jgi:glycosyltransferase involved in cell wall biosynthesis
MSTRYRLAILVDSMEIGGAERLVANLLTELPTDVAVAIIGPHEPILDSIAASRPGTLVYVTPMAIRPVRHALRRFAPTVVHANLTTFTACRPAIFAALSLRIPTVLVDHLPSPGLTWKGRWLQRAVTWRCAARVSVGTQASRLTERYAGLPAGSVGTIRNGVPTAPRRPDHTDDGPVVVGALARLEHQKGLDVLIRALAVVPAARLVIAGEGSQRVELERLARATGVADRVELLGFRSDATALLARFDVLAVPSREETFPLAMLEAMQAGVPVVATSVGSCAEAIINDSTGLLVPADDVDALAAALDALVRDPAKRASLGTRARQRARAEFTVRRMAGEYDALYTRVSRQRWRSADGDQLDQRGQGRWQCGPQPVRVVGAQQPADGSGDEEGGDPGDPAGGDAEQPSDRHRDHTRDDERDQRGDQAAQPPIESQVD